LRRRWTCEEVASGRAWVGCDHTLLRMTIVDRELLELSKIREDQIPLVLVVETFVLRSGRTREVVATGRTGIRSDNRLLRMEIPICCLLELGRISQNLFSFGAEIFVVVLCCRWTREVVAPKCRRIDVHGLFGMLVP